MSEVLRTVKKAPIFCCYGDKSHEVQKIAEDEALRPCETSENIYPMAQNYVSEIYNSKFRSLEVGIVNSVVQQQNLIFIRKTFCFDYFTLL